MGTPDIKVITGVRRSGKSKLLEAFRDYVVKNVPNANIIHINFNLTKFEAYKDYHALNDYIESSFKKGCENFVLIDEVQMCPNFELTINSIHKSSNSRLLMTKDKSQPKSQVKQSPKRNLGVKRNGQTKDNIQ